MTEKSNDDNKDRRMEEETAMKFEKYYDLFKLSAINEKTTFIHEQTRCQEKPRENHERELI